jgi:diacylglycerol kinase family enzyme
MASSTLPPHLLPDREVHVVVSILSGQHKAKGYYEETLQPLLDQYGIRYITHLTRSSKTIIELCEEVFIPNAQQGVKQTIILLSGDGGIVDIVNTFTTILMRHNDDARRPSIFLKPVICLIAMGTGNALAWSSGVAKDPVKTMMKGRPKPLPSFKICFSPGAHLVVNEGRERESLNLSDHDDSVTYGAVVASWGLHASLVAMSDTVEYRKHGVARFKMAAEQLLREGHKYCGKVQWREGNEDWIDVSGNEHSYVLATMVSNLEEHFQISPETQPVDGSLRLVAIGAEPGEEIMRLLGLAYQGGQHVSDPKVTYKSIEGLRIEMHEPDEQWRQVCVDGKIIAVAEGGWVEVTRIPGTGIDARRVVELVC